MRASPSLLFILTWLPFLPTTAKPARASTLTILRPDTTGRTSAAYLHEGNERRETRVRDPGVHVLQVEAYRLAEGGERLLHRCPLAGDVQLGAEGNVDLSLPRNDGGEPHGDTHQTHGAHQLKPFHVTNRRRLEHPTVTMVAMARTLLKKNAPSGHPTTYIQPKTTPYRRTLGGEQIHRHPRTRGGGWIRGQVPRTPRHNPGGDEERSPRQHQGGHRTLPRSKSGAKRTVQGGACRGARRNSLKSHGVNSSRSSRRRASAW